MRFMRPIELGVLQGLASNESGSHQRVPDARKGKPGSTVSAESGAISRAHHVATDLQFDPVADIGEALARVPGSEVGCPASKDRLHLLDNRRDRLRA